MEHARAVTTGRGGVGLRDLEAVTVGVVLGVHGDERGHAEAALVLLAHFGTRALGRHHDHREVRADLLPLLHDVEAVAVSQTRALLHERHDALHHVGVLLVGREVADEIGRGDHLVVVAHLEAVLRGVQVALALAVDGALTERVAHVEARVAHVEALVEALRAAAHDDDLLALELLDAVELARVHEAAAAELVELLGHGEGVEVVLAGHRDLS